MRLQTLHKLALAYDNEGGNKEASIQVLETCLEGFKALLARKSEQLRKKYLASNDLQTCYCLTG